MGFDINFFRQRKADISYVADKRRLGAVFTSVAGGRR